MKTVLKSLLVWVLLLAVPFQGFASATMLMCAPMQPATAAAPHDHGAMLAAQAAGHDHSTGQSAAGHHAKGKCNACAACCFGAAMPPSHFSRVPVEAQSFAVDPVDAGFVPAVDLAFPERPPISSLA